MTSKVSFFTELRRRNIYRAAVFYAGAAWLLVQIATQVFPFFDIANATVRVVVIATIIGFPFAMLFAWFFEWTPQGIKREAEVDRDESVTRQTGKTMDRWIIAVLGFAVILLLTDKLLLRRGTLAAGEKSIAVLPFVNSSSDPGNEYFSDGLSEELIGALGRLQNLKVISRTSSFQFKGTTGDSKSIGEKLGVSTLLEGSVRKQGERVRILAALVNVADGRQLWSETYDRELKDIFAVQSEIAGAVAIELQIALLGNNAETAKRATASVPSNQNVEAYNALLRGNFYVNRRTSEDYRKAIEQYRTAVRLDDGYALAWAKLSLVLSNLLGTGVEDSQRQALRDEVGTTAATALRLDPMLSEAYLALSGFHGSVDFDLAAQEMALRRAAELAPQDAGTLANLGTLKGKLGQFDDAVALTQRAIVLDPLRVATYQNLAINLIPLRRYDDAEAALRKGLSLQPQQETAYMRLAMLYILRGKPAEAVALANQEPEPFWQTYALALANFANGDRAAADAALEKLIHDDADDAGSQIATVYALRKDPDSAFKWLEHAAETKDAGVTEMREDPFLLAYKNDPRFIVIARKVGVMPIAEAVP